MEDIQNKIRDLCDFAINNPKNEYRILDFSLMEEELAKRVLLITGIDLTGFLLSIDNYSIVHTLTRHGNSEKEDKHGQIAVIKEDFCRLTEIMMHPDEIQLDTKAFRNGVIRETLIFSKEYEHFYVVAKEIRRVAKKGKLNRLILQTMYIRKKTKSASQ